jgi:hypothetical protein
MARKPNYQFERAERDRAKAAKQAQKAAAKAEQREWDRAADPADAQPGDAQPGDPRSGDRG